MVGEKVYLRPIELEDIDRGWLDWCNDPLIRDNLYGANYYGRDDLIKYHEQSKLPHAAMFAVCVSDNDQYVGNARLGKIDWVNRHCTYGRLMGDANYRDKGFGTEALILLLKYGFLKLGMNRIWTTVWIGNEASLTSNNNVGMRQEGVIKETLFKNGQFHDAVMLAMTRSNFDELHGSSV